VFFNGNEFICGWAEKKLNSTMYRPTQRRQFGLKSGGSWIYS